MKTPTEWLLEAHARAGATEQWKRAISHLQTVKIHPSSSVEVSMRGIRAKPKDCYLNALAVCMRNFDVEYVEGYLEVHGVPLDHAWNCYKGKHFDVTEESLRQEDRKIECPHRAIMILSGSEVMMFTASNGVSGPYLYEWLRNEEKRSSEEVAKDSR